MSFIQINKFSSPTEKNKLLAVQNLHSFQAGSFVAILFSCIVKIMHYENTPIQIYWKFYN